jgi:hypothetical protein
MRVRVATAIAVVAAVAFAAPLALGATFEVTNHNETGPGSLGETILEAGPGDTIQLGPGEYPLTEGETLTAQDNTIVGAGESVTTIVPTGGGEAVDSSNVVDATIAAPLKPSGDSSTGTDSKIETKARIVAVVATLAIFLLILELVRRRRLAERYALLWMLAALALLVLAIWTGGLEVIADLMGIQQPANAIFLLAFGAVFILLLHFSVATTRLADETKILAQENGRLDHELRVLRGESLNANGSGPADSEQAPHDSPVGTEDDA